jgi:non-ribosomal peptide synthetase component F
LVESLQAFARREQITVNALVQAAWALVLNRHSGCDDVVFGAAFSGRPADLAGVEAIVGPFVNNLPVRVRVNGGEAVADFLRQCHERQLQLSQHQFNSVLEIQGWSEVPWRHRLFDSLLVFQNYVLDESANRLGREVAVRRFVAPVRTNYPLTLVAEPGRELALTLVYETARFNAELAGRLLGDFQNVLRELVATPGKRVAEVLAAIPALARPAAAGAKPLRAQSQAFVPPQNDLERTLARIWAEAFGLEQVSTQDNFFDLGGHSLLMVRVHAQLRQALGKELSIVKVFQYPTIAALAKHLSEPGAETRTLQQAQNRAQRQREALAKRRPGMRE